MIFMPTGASSNRNIRLFVCLFVRNSVPLTNKVRDTALSNNLT